MSRGRTCYILAKNLPSFCPYPEYSSEADLLGRPVSRQTSIRLLSSLLKILLYLHVWTCVGVCPHHTVHVEVRESLQEPELSYCFGPEWTRVRFYGMSVYLLSQLTNTHIHCSSQSWETYVGSWEFLKISIPTHIQGHNCTPWRKKKTRKPYKHYRPP